MRPLTLQGEIVHGVKPGQGGADIRPAYCVFTPAKVNV